jgi:hypothetical protein
MEEEESEEEEFVPFEYRKVMTREAFLATEHQLVLPARNLLEGVEISVTGWTGSLRARPNQTLRATRALGWWVQSAQEEAAVRVLSIGESELSYCHSIWETRRVLLVQSGLSEKSTFVDVVRRSVALVELGALPAPSASAVLKAAFFRRCSQVLEAFDAGSKVELKTLNHCDRREIAVLLGAHVKCAHCPALKAEVMFEWDAGQCNWTRHGVVETRGKFRPRCSEPPPRQPEDEKWLCKPCARRGFWSCRLCRAFHCTPDTLDCACGGTAMPQASCYQPNSLGVKLKVLVDEFALAARNAPGPDASCESDGCMEGPYPFPDDLDWVPAYHEDREFRPPRPPVEFRGQKRLL